MPVLNSLYPSLCELNQFFLKKEGFIDQIGNVCLDSLDLTGKKEVVNQLIEHEKSNVKECEKIYQKAKYRQKPSNFLLISGWMFPLIGLGLVIIALFVLGPFIALHAIPPLIASLLAASFCMAAIYSSLKNYIAENRAITQLANEAQNARGTLAKLKEIDESFGQESTNKIIVNMMDRMIDGTKTLNEKIENIEKNYESISRLLAKQGMFTAISELANEFSPNNNTAIADEVQHLAKKITIF